MQSIVRHCAMVAFAAITLSACGGGKAPADTPTTEDTSPAILAVAPNPAVGQSTPQVITLTGRRFSASSRVFLSWTGQERYEVPSGQIEYLDATTLRIRITTLEVTDTWRVVVLNTDGKSSSSIPFEVVRRNDCSSEASAAIADDYPRATASTEAATFSELGFQTRTCTDYAAWRLNRDAGTTSSPYSFTNTMRSGRFSDAHNWDDNAGAIGFTVSTTPIVGAVAHWDKEELGPRSTDGHVAYVERVNADGTVNVSEYNLSAFTFSKRCNIRAPRYIYVNSSVIFEQTGTDATINLGTNESLYNYYFLDFTLSGGSIRGTPITTTFPVTEVMVRKVSGTATCGAIAGNAGLINDIGDLQARFEIGVEDGTYCRFRVNPTRVPTGTKLTAIYFQTEGLGTYALAGSSANSGRSINGFYTVSASGGFAFQICRSACPGGF